MSRWFFGLQFRLILGFALVIVLALGAASLYIGYAAQREVDRIKSEVESVRSARLEQLVKRFYSRNEGWGGVQPVLERAGSLYGRDIVIVDPVGRVVGDSRRRHGGQYDRYRKFEPPPHPVLIAGKKVGDFRVAASDAPEPIPEPPLSRFAVAINRSLLWAGIVTGTGGILLVSLLSRRALVSVRQLNLAARRLGSGDLAQRVPALGRDEIGELGRTFNVMAKGLEEAERQRRNLVADVAHELRTPLSNIQGYVEAVRDGVLEPDRGTVDTIHQQVLYLAHLVEDLRLLAEAESNELRLDLRPDSIAEVLDKSVEAFRPRAEAKGVPTRIDLAAGLPLVEMDRTRIAQVLDNLLENAVRHTPAGGAVGLTAEPVESEAVRITVSDGGEGVSDEALPYVFERFYRTDRSRARTTGGTGLGLTIAKQLLQAHGGTIRAESKRGHGSRFIFELPISRGPAAGGEVA